MRNIRIFIYNLLTPLIIICILALVGGLLAWLWEFIDKNMFPKIAGTAFAIGLCALGLSCYMEEHKLNR
jgi:hypothetical protein